MYPISWSDWNSPNLHDIDCLSGPSHPLQDRDVEWCPARSCLPARQPLLENHHLRRQRGGSPGSGSGWYATCATWLTDLPAGINSNRPPLSLCVRVCVCACRWVPHHETRQGPRVRQLHHLLHTVRVHGGSLHLPQTGWVNHRLRHT